MTIGRDFGTNLEILSGLRDSDEVIVNPPDSLTDGQPVAVQQRPAGRNPAASAAGAGH